MSIKVCKFGGTSLAGAKDLINVKEIVLSDSERTFIVCSAPGKRFNEDTKVTDLLFACFRAIREKNNFDEEFQLVKERFIDIVKGANVDIDIHTLLEDTRKEMLVKNETPDFIISRGEFLTAQIVAKFLGYNFVDANKIIRFDGMGELNESFTMDKTKSATKDLKNAVIPGFYGMNAFDEVVVFSRGGGDITGGLVAKAVGACVYENWTDVDGFMVADPKIVNNPKTISYLTYKEVRELSYMGATVIHPEAMFPPKSVNMPINLRNVFNRENNGTMIVTSIDNIKECSGKTITGIAGKKGFTIINIEKALMNNEIGFIRRVMSVLEHYGIVVEHIPTSIDVVSLVLPSDSLRGCNMGELLDEITKSVKPDDIKIVDNICLIATVGRNFGNRYDLGARLFGVLCEKKIVTRLVDMGASEENFIIGVDECDFENTIKAIYEEFKEEV